MSEQNFFSNLSFNFVYDNTIEKALNQFQGFRAKAEFDVVSRVSGEVNGFNRFNLDVRNYQPLFRDIIFATRFAYGRYGGNFPRVFLLGGVDNLFLRDFEENSEFDPLFLDTDENPYLLFSDFATNLRGFGFNRQNLSLIHI